MTRILSSSIQIAAATWAMRVRRIWPGRKSLGSMSTGHSLAITSRTRAPLISNTARASETSTARKCVPASAFSSSSSAAATRSWPTSSKSSSGDIQTAPPSGPPRVSRRPGICAPVICMTALRIFSEERSPRRVIMPCKPASRTITVPSKDAPFRALTASDILLLPVLVVDDRIDDPRRHHRAVDLGKFQHLSHPVRPVEHQPHGDAAPQRGRMIGRGHAPLRLALTIGVGALRSGIGAVRQHAAILGFQPHQLPPLGVGHVLALLRTLAEVILFLLRDRPVESQI